MDKTADYCLWSYPWFIGETGIEKECLSAVTQDFRTCRLQKNLQTFKAFTTVSPFFNPSAGLGVEVRFLAYRKRGSAQEKRVKKLI